MSNSDINYGQVGNQFRDWLKNEASLFVQEQDEDAHYAANCAFIAGYEAAKQDSWQPIETIPKDREILILSNLNNRYVGIWAMNVETGNEAFIIGNDGYGNQMVVELENIKSWCKLAQLPKEES